ncbi:phosphopantetheine-binding protein [Streptomyces sp. INA 01156]
MLGLPAVGPERSFFDLGGDSIVSIQLVSRARARGLVITPREVFVHRTAAALAVVARATEGIHRRTPSRRTRTTASARCRSPRSCTGCAPGPALSTPSASPCWCAPPPVRRSRTSPPSCRPYSTGTTCCGCG